MNQKEAFHERLKFLMGTCEPFKFAKRIGIPNATFARMLADKSIPKYEHLCRIAQNCDVSLDWLLFGKEKNDSHGTGLETNAALLPVVGFASCGLAQGWFNENDLKTYLSVTPKPDSDSFGIVCRGQSMRPMGIEDGDICIVCVGKEAEKGKPALIRTRTLYKGETRDVSAVKRFDGISGESVRLTGWLDADDSGHQDSFCEERRLDVVVLIAPVVRILKKSTVSELFSDLPSFQSDKLEACFDALAPYFSSTDSKGLAKLFQIFYGQTLKSEGNTPHIEQRDGDKNGGKHSFFDNSKKKSKK